MKEQRKKNRIKSELKAKLKSEGISIDGEITDQSEDGLFFSSEQILEPGKKVFIKIETENSNEELPPLEGKVVWNRTKSETKAHPGMGIELLISPEKYLKLVFEARNQPLSKQRYHHRFPFEQNVKLQADKTYIEAKTKDISLGGFFISSENTMPVDTQLEAELNFPGKPKTIKVSCRVAHTLSAAEAQQKGLIAGMGVKIEKIDPKDESLLKYYLTRVQTFQSYRLSENIILPDSGSLRDYMVPEIIWNILERRVSGKLELNRQGLKKIIYFKNGHPIYVESTIREEMLGHFLLKRKMISEEDFIDSLKDLEEGHLRHGEIMVKRGMIGQSDLCRALIEHQEDKLGNTFCWYDGSFSFEELHSWPDHLSITAIRTIPTLLAGIQKWYPSEAIAAWTSLDENQIIERKNMDRIQFDIPTQLLRFFNYIFQPRRLDDIKKSLNFSEASLHSYILFGLITHTIVFRDHMDSEASAHLPQSSPEVLDQNIQSMATQSSLQNFCQMLQLDRNFSTLELEENYAQLMMNIDHELQKHLLENDKSTLLHFKHNVQLAYDVLKDPSLKKIYLTKNKSVGTSHSDTIAIEKVLFSSFRDISKRNFANAQKKLEDGVQRFPLDSSIKGYLAWVLFKIDPQKSDTSVDLLQSALSLQSTDAQLWYFLAAILYDQGHKEKALKCVMRCLAINPELEVAEALFKQIRSHA